MPAKDSANNKLWVEGPEFLLADESDWPPRENRVVQPTVPELRKGTDVVMVTQSVVQSQSDVEWSLTPDRFSSWKVLVRKTAWVRRLPRNCSLPPEARMFGELSVEELSEAESVLLRNEQRAAFASEYQCLEKGKAVLSSSKLASLTPFLDQDGVTRVRGRLQQAEYLAYDTRHPIILPRKGPVTSLIVRMHHLLGHHAAGVSHTVSMLMAKFWILSVREAVREFESSCAGCILKKS